MFFYFIYIVFLFFPKIESNVVRQRLIYTEKLHQFFLRLHVKQNGSFFLSTNGKVVNNLKKKTDVPKHVPLKSVPINNEVRLRFAPSPTGSLHVGGCRTFLYNYILSKQLKGSLILRFEDTDVKRNAAGSTEEIIKDLKWLELHWDEGPDKGGVNGPYNQSERVEIYKQVANKLVEEGKAYFCFCSEEELMKKKEKAKLEKKKYVYERTCRDLSDKSIRNNLEKGTLYTIRFKSPYNTKVILHDILKETITDVVKEDFIILRSNKLPTYNFSTSVDDHLMKITHVLRGVEHISNTFKQILILKALNSKIPIYAHVPVLITPEKKKISKRKREYTIKHLREEGFKPECLINYLGVLGWGSISKKEFYTLGELVKDFNIHALNKSSIVFNMDKLRWMNKQYLLNQDQEVYVTEATQYLAEHKIISKDTSTKDFIEFCIQVFKNEVHSYSELKEYILKVISYNEKTKDKTCGNKEILRHISVYLYKWSERFMALNANDDSDNLEAYLENNYQDLINSIMKNMSLAKKDVLLKLRFLLTFQNKGIPFIFLMKMWKLAKQNNIPSYFPLKKRILYLKQMFHF